MYATYTKIINNQNVLEKVKKNDTEWETTWKLKITNTTAGSRGIKYISVGNNKLRTCERI
jgi:capsular polysaccharide biosynthesis protein